MLINEVILPRKSLRLCESYAREVRPHYEELIRFIIKNKLNERQVLEIFSSGLLTEAMSMAPAAAPGGAAPGAAAPAAPAAPAAAPVQSNYKQVQPSKSVMDPKSVQQILQKGKQLVQNAEASLASKLSTAKGAVDNFEAVFDHWKDKLAEKYPDAAVKIQALREWGKKNPWKQAGIIVLLSVGVGAIAGAAGLGAVGIGVVMGILGAGIKALQGGSLKGVVGTGILSGVLGGLLSAGAHAIQHAFGVAEPVKLGAEALMHKAAETGIDVGVEHGLETAVGAGIAGAAKTAVNTSALGKAANYGLQKLAGAAAAAPK